MLVIHTAKSKDKRPKLRQRKCVICGIDFLLHIAPSSIALGHGILCSRECKNKWNGLQKTKSSMRVCATCKKDFPHKPSQDRRGNRHIYCSRACQYPHKKLSLPVGQYLAYDGYIVLNRLDDGRKQVKLHRYIMEQSLERRLAPSEIVHHINENKLDNRLENLQVVTRSEHNKIHGLLKG